MYALITSLIWYAVIAIIIFVVAMAGRSFVLWYFGITAHLRNQQTIIALLERSAPPVPNRPVPARLSPKG